MKYKIACDGCGEDKALDLPDSKRVRCVECGATSWDFESRGQNMEEWCKKCGHTTIYYPGDKGYGNMRDLIELDIIDEKLARGEITQEEWDDVWGKLRKRDDWFISGVDVDE